MLLPVIQGFFQATPHFSPRSARMHSALNFFNQLPFLLELIVLGCLYSSGYFFSQGRILPSNSGFARIQPMFEVLVSFYSQLFQPFICCFAETSQIASSSPIIELSVLLLFISSLKTSHMSGH